MNIMDKRNTAKGHIFSLPWRGIWRGRLVVLVIIKPTVVIQDGPLDLLNNKLEIVCANDSHWGGKTSEDCFAKLENVTLSPAVWFLNVVIEIEW